jgi:hypothetical protein
MKYLVESDQERQAEPPADPIDAFLKHCGKSKNVFSNPVPQASLHSF